MLVFPFPQQCEDIKRTSITKQILQEKCEGQSRFNGRKYCNLVAGFADGNWALRREDFPWVGKQSALCALP